MNFNLVDQPWISVSTGKASSIMSLSGVISNLKNIQEIDASPTEKISVFRLLLAIIQAALGPFSEKNYLKCKEMIQKKTLQYLKKHKSEFNLYGSFLQIPDLAKKNNATISKLFFNRASGNNHTLFDNISRGNIPKIYSSAEIALALLTYQVLCPGGLLKDKTFGEEETTGLKAPIHGNLVTIIKESNLLDSIHSNLVSTDLLGNFSFGKPVWEYNLNSKNVKKIKDIERTYLYNLVPLSRSIFIEEEKQVFTLAGGIPPAVYPDYRDPMLTIISIQDKTKKEESSSRPLKISPEKAPWRELQSILQVPAVGDGAGGSIVLRRLSPQKKRKIQIWSGGLSCKRAKLLDIHEWVYDVDTALLGDTTLQAYKQAMIDANHVQGKIRFAIQIYSKAVNETKKRTGPGKESFLRKSLESEALRMYWAALEAENQQLLNAFSSNSFKDTERKRKIALEVWKKKIKSISMEAFQSACEKFLLKNFKEYTLAINYLRRDQKNEK